MLLSFHLFINILPSYLFLPSHEFFLFCLLATHVLHHCCLLSLQFLLLFSVFFGTPPGFILLLRKIFVLEEFVSLILTLLALLFCHLLNDSPRLHLLVELLSLFFHKYLSLKPYPILFLCPSLLFCG